MGKTRKARMDFMNRNAIISLAMLYALWQSKRQDLLDLIRPFILYAAGTTTKIGQEIDVAKVCECMEREFGYQSFQRAVVDRVLARETSSSIPTAKRSIERRSKKYFLSSSLSDLIDDFSAKRTVCKSHSDAVTVALAAYLNQQRARKRDNYTQAEAETILLSFFERQGSSIMLSVDDLRQLTAKNHELDFFVGRFILAESDKHSVIMDYLIELVKGYFVTTALYLQAENNNITTASFSDVTFYLDTRLLLGYLGYKSKPENDSVQEMVKSLQKNGAKLACFPYNIDEVYSILEAYKQSTISKSKRPSTMSLEFFDERGRSYVHADAAQRLFENRLKDGQIKCVSSEQALQENHIDQQSAGLLNDDKLAETLLSIKPTYNLATLQDDINAINTVSRIRNGKKLPYIEKCRAVFVTTNDILVAATKQYLKSKSSNADFPIAITGDDLCVIAWLKDFEQNNSLPQMRLLENVLAAIHPSQELMEAYFSNLDSLEHHGKITEEEAALLRVDLFARNELMQQTRGDKDNLNDTVIESIRQKLRAEDISKGIQIGVDSTRKQMNAEFNKHRNLVCKQAEEEIDEEFAAKEKRAIRTAKIMAILVAAAFIAASCVALYAQWDSPVKWPLFVVTAITTLEGACLFFSGDNFVIRYLKRKLQDKKLKALDTRKQKYLSILEQK